MSLSEPLSLCLLGLAPPLVSKSSWGPKTAVECLVSSSTTRVWCTVSTSEDREAEPSVVFSRVGPKTAGKEAQSWPHKGLFYKL